MTASRPPRCALVWLTVGLAFSACGGPTAGNGATDGPFFPIWHPTGAPTPQGTLAGRLIVEDDCVLWDAGEQGVVLPLWPDEIRLDSQDVPTLQLEDGRSILPGDEAVLVGGERSLSDARDLTGQDIPARCRASSIWMATSVLS